MPPEADSSAVAPAEEVSAEELQQRRRERREARRRQAPDQGEADVLNQILQNQITINQNQTTIDQSTTTNQVIVNQQTVQQQQVIEQQTGPSPQGEQASERPGLLDRARRRGERLARLEAQARERELRGELRATQRELERTRDELRDSRLRLGDEIIRRDADRIIVRRGDQILVLRADNESRFGHVEDVERLPNGYVRSVAVRGEIRIVTLYDPEGAIVRRSRVLPSGEEMVLIDAEPAIRVRERRGRELPPVVVKAPREEIVIESRRASTEDIEAALAAPPVVELPRTFTLEEVRFSEQVRDLVSRVDLDTITFEFDSAFIPEDQLITLEKVGIALEDILFENPNEVFLIEGHTDAPGTDVYNLALSDRRAEAVAMALSENFDVPPENLVTQGYGEEHLKIPTAERERANRRVSIRRITALVSSAEAP
jgi:outer membrane protein OmpA-like peptidoglycan-associated protein